MTIAGRGHRSTSHPPSSPVLEWEASSRKKLGNGKEIALAHILKPGCPDTISPSKPKPVHREVESKASSVFIIHSACEPQLWVSDPARAAQEQPSTATKELLTEVVLTSQSTPSLLVSSWSSELRATVQASVSRSCARLCEEGGKEWSIGQPQRSELDRSRNDARARLGSVEATFLGTSLTSGSVFCTSALRMTAIQPE